MFSLFLLFGVIVSAIFRSPGIRDTLDNVRTFDQRMLFKSCVPQSFLCEHLVDGCTRVVGFLAVYRIMFAVASFYFLFSVTMLFVRNSRDPRAYIQNGYIYCIVY